MATVTKKTARVEGDQRWRKILHEAMYYVLLIGAILVFRSALAENYVIPSGSMEPTLKEGDYLFALKCAYNLRVPFTGIQILPTGKIRRGDIVIFRSVEGDGNKLIKRVVGLPGDEIVLRHEQLFVNGEAVPRTEDGSHAGLYDLPDAARKTLYVENLDGVQHFIFHVNGSRFGDESGPYKVPPGHVFVMGDNRDQSRDSRFFGAVPIRSVLGRAGIIYMSWDKRAGFPFWRLRLERLGRVVR